MELDKIDNPLQALIDEGNNIKVVPEPVIADPNSSTPITKEGSIVDEPKEEVKEGEEKKDETATSSDESDSVIDSLIEDLGFIPAEGATYEDSRAGASQLVNDMINVKANEAVNNYFESIPMLKVYHDFIVNGGNPNDYFSVNHPVIDFGKLDLESNDTNQRLVIGESLRQQGMSEEAITDTLNTYASTGILDKMAKITQPILKKAQEDNAKRLLQETENKKKEQETFVNNYWNAVIGTVKKSDAIKGLNIPVKDKDSFIQYMAIEKENGLSQWQLDMNNENQGKDLETTIALAYLRFKKFDLSGLIKKEAATQIATQKKYSFEKGQNKNVKSGIEPITKNNLPDNIHTRLLEEEAAGKR